MGGLQLFSYILILVFVNVSGISTNTSCNRISNDDNEMKLILETTCGNATNKMFEAVKTAIDKKTSLDNVTYTGCGKELELFWTCYNFCKKSIEKNHLTLTSVSCNCTEVEKQDKKQADAYCHCKTKRKSRSDHAYVQKMPAKRMLCKFERKCLKRHFQEQKCYSKAGTHSTQTHDIGKDESVELGEKR